MNKKIIGVTEVTAKVLEIFCLVVTLAYLALLVLSVVFPTGFANFIAKMAATNRGELFVQGFDIIVLDGSGMAVKSAVVAFAAAGFLSFVCRVMMFRNVHLILKTAAGKTWFSKGETPFQKDTSRMVREIGIFYIMIPVLQTLVNVAFRFVTSCMMESSVEMEGIVTGLIILALSQIFTYGEKLESEVEGLV